MDSRFRGNDFSPELEISPNDASAPYLRSVAIAAGLLQHETGMERIDRITIDPARMNGEACIRDLRLTVRRVLEVLAVYADRSELKREYPELEDEDIRQALVFAAAMLDDKVFPLPAAR